MAYVIRSLFLIVLLVNGLFVNAENTQSKMVDGFSPKTALQLAAIGRRLLRIAAEMRGDVDAKKRNSGMLDALINIPDFFNSGRR
ncbi:DgyrCDS14068 [Dimorphilus gyrociliatus]|uniref:DgyrCDS14068 n=1 Tax=Dimorphilus gyrociliatus TaxID=2664684 RepID=A0A7I8WCN6_9ANNE|nr:DgyrCDS14068 [Dimorphilus gyrociliatus]